MPRMPTATAKTATGSAAILIGRPVYRSSDLAIRPQVSGQPWSQARAYSETTRRSLIGPLLPRSRIGSSFNGGDPLTLDRPLVRAVALAHAGSKPSSQPRFIDAKAAGWFTSLSACSTPSSLHDHPEPARHAI